MLLSLPKQSVSVKEPGRGRASGLFHLPITTLERNHTSMATEAQIKANQSNAQHSTGPQTPGISCYNNFTHGFAGDFMLLPIESTEQYEAMLAAFRDEHKPTSMTEQVLVERLTQHQWLIQRALNFQYLCMADGLLSSSKEKKLALYLRYQTTNERAFSKCLSDLLKLRSERRKEQIGFESQKLHQAEHARKQSIENRKQEAHQYDLWLAEAKAEHQELLNSKLETPETRNPHRLQRILTRQQAA